MENSFTEDYNIRNITTRVKDNIVLGKKILQYMNAIFTTKYIYIYIYI